MKKQSIAQYLCIGMAAFLFMACSQEEEAEKVNVSVPLRVMINNGQSSLTRATLSGLSTEFEADDTIGIYIANEDRTQYDNVPYVFDGTDWYLASGEYVPKRVSFLAGYEYYAYYPYKESPDSWPYYNDEDNDGDCTADEFFSNTINYWNPLEDQSTKANFNASDLMAGKGTIVDAQNGVVSFNLDHKMGLIKIELLNGNGGHITNISASSAELFSDDSHTPFKIGDEFYQIAKPNQLFSLYFKAPVDYIDAKIDTVTPRPGRLSHLEFVLY